jgi:hypothetical protein
MLPYMVTSCPSRALVGLAMYEDALRPMSRLLSNASLPLCYHSAVVNMTVEITAADGNAISRSCSVMSRDRANLERWDV